ncbi:hypothetical protein LCGC14_0639490 [marine sediment metagenome]|uniref:Uncharacterized protein n=1 Tax=marine sediment metagenome TaxID=412755 RepID=A0A0F9R4S3_9ZZZZ|nr:MAG: hypothetical protein Lokiarch_54020 [Candidatus Lokiarchaeum sp. GC14_75]
MRNKIIGMVILIIALSLLTIGIAQGQHNLIEIIYEIMPKVP